MEQDRKRNLRLDNFEKVNGNLEGICVIFLQRYIGRMNIYVIFVCYFITVHILIHNIIKVSFLYMKGFSTVIDEVKGIYTVTQGNLNIGRGTRKIGSFI